MTSFLLFEDRSTALRCRFSHQNGHRKLSPVADLVIFCRFSQKWSLRVVRSDRFGDSCALRQKVVRNVVFQIEKRHFDRLLVTAFPTVPGAIAARDRSRFVLPAIIVIHKIFLFVCIYIFKKRTRGYIILLFCFTYL